MLKIIFIMMLVVCTFSFAYAQSESLIPGSKTYSLNVNEDNFSIPYQIDGQVIAMDVDQESKSLLIGIRDSHDSIFTIALDSHIISAINDEFVVLVDGVDVDYELTKDKDMTKLNFFVPADSEEVEIIGTSVVPEFPLGMMAMITIIMSGAIILTRFKKSIFT